MRDYSPLSARVARAVRADNGASEFYWAVVDFMNEPPLEEWKSNGPFATSDEADRDASATMRAFLGPQCEITEGGVLPKSLGVH